MLIEIIFTSIIILAQLAILLISIHTRKKQYALQLYVNIVFICFIGILGLTKLIDLDLRILPLFLVLLIQSIWNGIDLCKKTYIPIQRKKRYMMLRILRIIGFIIVSLPFLIFPYYKQILPSGSMKVRTTTITWKNDATIQSHIHASKASKTITAQFWYPKTKHDKEEVGKTGVTYPLVVFSHGFSMFRNSNLSLFEELASNGYIVCSIDLDYESLWSVQENGKIIFQNLDELKDINAATTDESSYKVCEKWNEIRANDLNYAIDHIVSKADAKNSEEIFHKIDTKEIAMVGHSFGGASAVTVGRENNLVKAAVDMDGTAFGEIKEITKKTITEDTTPYPKPILMMFSQPHYEIIPKFEKIYGDTYPNKVILEHAKDGYSADIKGSDHFSFSDMHINAPIAAFVSGGTQTRDSRTTIKVINHTIEQFLDKYLKGKPINIQKDAIY